MSPSVLGGSCCECPPGMSHRLLGANFLLGHSCDHMRHFDCCIVLQCAGSIESPRPDQAPTKKVTCAIDLVSGR
jgi:hypothetical protein